VIHPSNVRSIILIGAPLLGSPRSFANLYDRATFPGIEAGAWIWWFKKRDLALERLRMVAQSFVSLYQLLPPRSEPYLNDESSGTWINPLDGNVIEAAKSKAAADLQMEIARAFDDYPVPASQVHVLYTNDQETESAYWVRQATKGSARSYEVRGKGETAGDGTVLERSALYRNAASSIASVHAPLLGAEHSEMCDDGQTLSVLRGLLG
jgi:hypothetical protein